MTNHECLSDLVRMHAKVLWQEDDTGTLDREQGYDAWQRLFGEKRPGEFIAQEDAGDTFYYLYPGGRVYILSCGLTEIRQLDMSDQYVAWTCAKLIYVPTERRI